MPYCISKTIMVSISLSFQANYEYKIQSRAKLNFQESNIWEAFKQERGLLAERHKHILTLEQEWEQTGWLVPDHLLMNFHLHEDQGTLAKFKSIPYLCSLFLYFFSLVGYLGPQKELGDTVHSWHKAIMEGMWQWSGRTHWTWWSCPSNGN